MPWWQIMPLGQLKQLTFIALALCAAPALAHHGTAASYDQDRWITVTGTVTEFLWRNPHCSLFLDVIDESGDVVSYAIELASPGLMVRRNGWRRDTFAVGDEVAFRVHPSRTGAPVGECLFGCEVAINGDPAPTLEDR
jgi:hypothetical protein